MVIGADTTVACGHGSMKILHYFARFRLEDGGVVRALLDLAGLMTAGGHQVEILTLDPTDIPEEWKQGNASLPKVTEISGISGPLGRLNAAANACWQEALSNADAVHLHTPWDPANATLAASAREAGIPNIVSIHGMLDDWSMAQRHLKKRLYLMLRGRKFLEHATYVHATASKEHEQASKWYPKGRGIVIPLVFDLSPYHQLPGPELARKQWPELATDLPTILFLSRLHPKKGAETLISAAQQLHDQGLKFRLVLAGSGEDLYVKELAKQVDDAGLTSTTTFTGHVSGDLKLALYEAADVMALPTNQENFGFIFPESLACATPVITTKGVDTWPELEASGGAVIVNRTPEDFAHRIKELLTDRGRALDMGQAGRTWVFDTFANDTILSQYVEMYENQRTPL